MRKTLLVALVMLFPSLVAAQDVLGLYFDEQGNSIHRYIPPFVPTQVFLVLNLPSVTEIVGWEAAVGVSGTAHVLETSVLHGGANSRTEPQFVVTYSSPLPCSDPTVLMTITFFPIDSVANCISLSAVDNPSIAGTLPVLYLMGGEYLQPQVYYTGTDNNIVAQINGAFSECAHVVPASTLTWGAVKSHYR